MPGIAFVHAGDAFAREVYRVEGRGYWSAALPIVLEKHGFLGIDVMGIEDLPGALADDRTDVVLLARQAHGVLDEALAEAMIGGACPVLVEGPLPQEFARALGVVGQAPIPRGGYLKITDGELFALGSSYGLEPGGVVREPVGRPIAREPEYDWVAADGVPLSLAQAAAWRAAPWESEAWTVDESADVLATWSEPETSVATPAVVRRGRLLGCSFGLFGFLGFRHTAEPSHGAEYRTAHRSMAVEAALLGLIDLLHRQRGRTRPRALPWPRPYTWVRSVRHDFDRPMEDDAVARVLERHGAAGSRATWYWRAEPRGPLARQGEGAGDLAAAKLVAAVPEHEVALHTELLWHGGEYERREVEAAIEQPVIGSSAHGAANCFRFQGAPNVLWAEKEGLEYTELVEHFHLHPHRFAALRPDGSIEPSDVICLPHHASFDKGMTEDYRDVIEDGLGAWIAAGGFLQIMNHPDVNEDALFAMLGSMVSEGCLDLTAREAVDWWRRTHVAGNLRIIRLDDGEMQVEAETDIESLAIELLAVDGGRRVLTIDVGPGRPAPFVE